MSCFLLGELESLPVATGWEEGGQQCFTGHTHKDTVSVQERTCKCASAQNSEIWRKLNLGFWVRIETDYVFAKGDVSEVTSVTGRSGETQSTQKLFFIIATSICWAYWQMLWWLKEVGTYWLFTVPLTRNLDTVDTQSGHASSGCENLDLILHNDPPCIHPHVGNGGATFLGGSER